MFVGGVFWCVPACARVPHLLVVVVGHTFTGHTRFGF